MKASTVLFAASLACSVSGAPMFRVFPLEHHPGTSARPITSGPIVRLRFSTGFKSIAQPDNHPYTPSSLVTPSEALAAPRPLRTTYLLSLESNSETHNAKSTSEQSSIVREETGVASRTKTQPTILELETEGSKPVFHHVPCNMHGDVHFHQVRKYADMVIVSIVLTFIGVVALIELWNPVCRRLGALRNREGCIRLDDDDEKAPWKQMDKPALQPVLTISTIHEPTSEMTLAL